MATPGAPHLVSQVSISIHLRKVDAMPRPCSKNLVRTPEEHRTSQFAEVKNFLPVSATHHSRAIAKKEAGGSFRRPAGYESIRDG